MTMIPFIDIQAQLRRLDGRLDRAIATVLTHGQFIMGPEVRQLEAQLAQYCGAAHCVSCASGTDALVLVLMAHGVGPGDAVFVPAMTFVATAEAAALLGATPVFTDIDEQSFTMSCASLKAAIGEARRLGLRPRVVIPVDLFGHPADYEALVEVAEAEGMTVCADAAQSFGASVNDRKVGTLAQTTATSFFPAKPLGCLGDGGAVFTDDAELAGRMRSLRVHGQGTHKYDNVRVGLNARLDTIQAAVLIEKLSIFPDEVAARGRIARRYGEALAGLVQVPTEAPGYVSVWAQYTIRVPRRDDVAEALKQRGIPTAVYYPLPLHLQTGYRDFPRDPCGLPISEALAGDVLSLPMHPYLDEATQDRISSALSSILHP